MKHAFPALLTSAALLCSCGTKTRPKTKPEPEYPLFSATFFDIGKADSILLQTENHTVLIDCGEKKNGEEIAEQLKSNSITTIDYLIITHFDKDHIGGAAKIMKSVSVSNVIEPSYTEDSEEFDKYRKTLNEKNIVPIVPSEPLRFTLDDAEFTVDPPERDFYGEDDDNDFSLITTVSHHEKTFIFTGDAMEQRLNEAMGNSGCDLLKIPYHGRSINNLAEYLDSVSPEYAVICTSKKELSDDTAKLLSDRNIMTYSTFSCGDIKAVSDGKSITVTCAGSTN